MLWRVLFFYDFVVHDFAQDYILNALRMNSDSILFQEVISSLVGLSPKKIRNQIYNFQNSIIDSL